MNERRQGRVIGAVVNYGLGSYVPQIVNFLLVPIYARYLTPADLGVVEVCVTVGGMMVLLMRLGLNGALVRFYFEYPEGPRLRDLVTTIAIAVVAVSLAMLGVSLLAGPAALAVAFPEVPFHPYMDLVLVAAVLQAAPDLQRRLLQAREQAGLSARLTASFGVLTTLLNLVFVIGLDGGAKGVLWANLIAAALYAATAAYLNRRDLRGRFSWPMLRQAAGYGLPLVPHHAAAQVHKVVGRWVLTAAATLSVVGELGLAARLASPLALADDAFTTGYSPVYLSWRTRLSRDAALVEVGRIARAVLALGTIAVIGAGAFGPLVVRFATPASYRGAAPVVGLVAAAFFAHMIYHLLSNELFYSKRTRWVSGIFIAVAAVNIALVLAFAARLGALAAAGAQVAGGVVGIVLVGIVAVRTFPLPFSVREVAVAALGCAAGCSLAWLLPEASLAASLAEAVAAFAGLTAAVLVASGAGTQIWTDLSRLRGRGRAVATAEDEAA